METEFIVVLVALGFVLGFVFERLPLPSKSKKIAK
jgi:hypothetical protein